VEYKGAIPAGPERQGAAAKIEAACAELIATGASVSVSQVEYDQIAEVCGECPSYMPKGKPARIIRMHVPDPLSGHDAFGCPCGGTHVSNVKAIGKVRVRKVTVRKGNTRVSYDVEDN
jgi:Ser-tRNA(Ala) deacylase AlaX